MKRAFWVVLYGVLCALELLVTWAKDVLEVKIKTGEGEDDEDDDE